ncbi:MAG: hypothetical protein EPO40_34960 [Myxococcaceae bacterium]|nr:MAG: hypothetical protein EPO40_34960 [Myxococcaceae bacterium]
MTKRSSPWLVASLSLLGACSDEAVDVDRNAVLRDLADNVLIPTCARYGTSARALATALDALCASPTAGLLGQARDQWWATRLAWKEAQVFQAGPFEALRMQATVDWYLVDASAVEATIEGGDPLTVDSVASLGANRRGLPGLEVVLFDGAIADEALVARLRGGASPTRRCQYLVAVGEQVARTSEAFVAAWQPDGGAYGRTLATAGQGSTIATTREAVDLVVNQLSNTLETLEVTRLSIPEGSRSGGTPQPDRVESSRSNASVAEVAAGLRGVRAIYLGTYGARSGLGLTSMVAARSPSLDRSVRAELDACEASLRAITLPLQRAVLEQRPSVDAAVTELGRLKRLLRVDVANLLGVTISFNSNDGD